MASPLIVQFARATVNPNADLPTGYEQYAGQLGIVIQRYDDESVCLQFDAGVKLYFSQDEIDEQPDGYYCGLCGCLMPISHFPH